MSRVDGLRHRVHVLLRGEAYADEIRREMRFHRELAELADSGHSIGNETYYCEEVRRMTLMTWVDRVQQDVSYAWRGLTRSRAFTAGFVATLALGLGVNSAMYSFLDQLFTRPPGGVVGPEKVDRLYMKLPSLATRGLGAYGAFTYTKFVAVHDAARHPERVAAFTTPDGGLLIDGTSTDSVRTIHVSPEYFDVLGVHPLIGRFFGPQEYDVAVPTPVAVISERLWRRVYGSKASVLRRSIQIDDRRVTIVGVASTNFTGIDLNAGDVWLPLNMFPVAPRNGQPWYRGFGNYLGVISRIEEPSERVQLTTSGALALRAIRDVRQAVDTATILLTGPINQAAGPASKPRETMLAQRLSGVALLVLFMACANLTNLLLVRSTQRRREFAVRRALGVSRARLIQQMLTESLLLCVIGAATTLLFAAWAGTALRRLLFPTTHWSAAAVDLRVVAVTIAASVAVAMITGLIPAIGASNPDLVASLKATLSGGARSSHTQNTLLGLQAAITVMLLVAAGLVIRSFDNVRSIDLGYAVDDVITARPSDFPRDMQAARAAAQRLPDVMARLRARPDVRAVGIASTAPMSGYAVTAVFLPGNDRRLPVSVTATTGDYFAAAGVQLVAGRALSPADVAGSERVAVVSERMAREVWPNQSALGRCLALGKPDAGCTRVVGITRDTHRMQILEEGVAQFYLPAAQQEEFMPSSFIVRVQHGRAKVVAAALRDVVQPLLPPKTTMIIQTMAKVLEPQLRPWRMGAILFLALGILALTVASVGI